LSLTERVRLTNIHESNPKTRAWSVAMSKIRTWFFVKTLFDTWWAFYYIREELEKEGRKTQVSTSYTQLLSNGLKHVEQTDQIGLLAQVKKQMQIDLKRSKESMEEIPLILMNQDLVMMCTVFDDFLCHVLSSILIAQPKTLLTLAAEKQIKPEDVIKARDKEEILQNLIDKVTSEFSWRSIREKFDIFKRIGLSLGEIFGYAAKWAATNTASGFDLEGLVGAYDKRHDVVHKRVLPITDPDQLFRIYQFFSSLIYSLSWVVYKKFQVDVDFLILPDRDELNQGKDTI